MSAIQINGDTSGSITLQAPAASGPTTLLLPAMNGTVALTSQTGGFKNKLINGAFDIWQRGDSFTPTPATTSYTADRWAVRFNGACTISKVAGSFGVNAVKLQRNAGDSTVTQISFLYAMETADSVKLAGKQVTISVVAKAGANYSTPAGGGFRIYVVSGTGIDQSITLLSSNSWTGYTQAIIDSSNVLTTSFQTFTATGTLPADCSQVGVQIAFIPTGTAGADDSVIIDFVQLEVGGTATPFEFRPIGTELALCQRYFQQATYITGGASSTTQSPCSFGLPVVMRAVPVATTVGTWSSQPYGLTSTASPTIYGLGPCFCNLSSTGLTVGAFMVWTGAYMNLSAEL